MTIKYESEAFERIKSEIEKLKERLTALSHAIHEQPELAFKESTASEQVASFMESVGFKVTRGAAGMSTAVKAVYSSGKQGPVIAYLAEYDALPQIGHACGHNVIAASAVGAAAALSRLADETGGTVILMGTPAEEIGGGKIRLLNNGDLNDIDFALMMHPSNRSLIGRKSTACSELILNFKGKSAHSSKPEEGINALHPLIQVFNAIGELLPTLSHKARINGIITEGGAASNVIVDHACGKFLIRSEYRKEVIDIIEKIQVIAQSEAAKIGASVSFSHDEIYAERYANMVLEKQFMKHMQDQNEEMAMADPNEPTGSSDLGNVSMVIPSIHPYVAIADGGIIAHTSAFADASASERADTVVQKSAVALAMTGWELLTDSGLRKAALEEFGKTVPKA
jgi:amidohydrolase